MPSFGFDTTRLSLWKWCRLKGGRSLAPAATAADATGFDLLKRYIDGQEPALPEGYVLDVDFEAKELLSRFLPAVEEAYRGMRAELGRRPTPMELFHAQYLPHTLRAAHGSWFGFAGPRGILMQARRASSSGSGRGSVCSRRRTSTSRTRWWCCECSWIATPCGTCLRFRGSRRRAARFSKTIRRCERISRGRPSPACRGTPFST